MKKLQLRMPKKPKMVPNMNIPAKKVKGWEKQQRDEIFRSIKAEPLNWGAK